MSLFEQVLSDWKTAFKLRSPDKDALGELKAELQMRAKNDMVDPLSDEVSLAVLKKLSDTFKESVVFATQAGREDLRAEATAKLAVVTRYLPQQLSTEELTQLVQKAVTDSGATSLKDLGKVMKLLVPLTKGKADGSQVQTLVKSLLPQ